MQLTMIRSVNERKRWYRLEVVPNLFGEWLLIRSFGSISNPKPIGTMVELFSDEQTALQAYKKLTDANHKRGYESSIGS